MELKGMLGVRVLGLLCILYLMGEGLLERRFCSAPWGSGMMRGSRESWGPAETMEPLWETLPPAQPES